jgi:hypothetical protein
MVKIFKSETSQYGGVHYDLKDKVFDPELERLGDFFMTRMPVGEITFEQFIQHPEWAFSIYGRSSQTFAKALGG